MCVAAPVVKNCESNAGNRGTGWERGVVRVEPTRRVVVVAERERPKENVRCGPRPCEQNRTVGRRIANQEPRQENNQVVRWWRCVSVQTQGNRTTMWQEKQWEQKEW